MATVSPDGREHWPAVVAKSAAMHAHEPSWTPDDLATMLESVPDAELAVVPRATHGLIVEQPGVLAELVRTFHTTGRSDGVAPRRRAAGRP
ncbi:alpha/beta fold hydrolase [Curtobacterium sp. VKM Ac-2922]|uniref:alpha/beta fold hydrolase n=1 Tax=Curtobacterium sp. VKM Ac-2922 TaxID=2929475 RepID=UPI001FB3C4FE|nr:hypothetical protein [Curtobacterium sp. VKM Ac-2922]MCJ1715510.1 hypothetical protein [Curtobacterium sp. VKM Ac-2922]